MKRLVAGLALACVALAQEAPKAPPPDPILKVMAEEMNRSRRLALVEKPYFLEYQIEDVEMFNTSATMGALMNADRSRARIPQVQVRVGDYNFDNTNHVYSGHYSGTRQDPSQLPIDDNFEVVRRFLWLATDRAYKTAIEGMSRKRGSLKNTSRNADDQLPDFAHVTPSRVVLPVSRLTIDEAQFTKDVAGSSAVFREFPEIMESSVTAGAGQGISYYLNSEGTLHRTPDGLYEIRIRATAQTADGMLLRNGLSFCAQQVRGLPDGAQLHSAAREIAEALRALVKAPVEEAYSGPVLFEPHAAAQLFAQALGDNIRATRRPVSDPGKPAPYLQTEFEAKIGSRVLPEWMDVVDDSTQAEWRGHALAGWYPVDMEGVPPSPVQVVEKGVLKNLLTTRQPVKGFEQTNGHARLPGPYAVRTAAFGNLFIRASETSPLPALKQRLIDLCRQRGKAYGLIVRKLDYPTAMSLPDLRAFAGTLQGSGTRPISPPVLVHRVYQDGREELVRGLRFRNFSTRVLRDIVAASDDQYVFDFVNNVYPFAMMGGAGYVAPSSVIAPAVLLDEVDFEPAQEARSRPPAVPAPPID